MFLFDFNGLYGQDSYEYLRYSECLHNFLNSGADPGDYFWPLVYPLAGAGASFFLKPSVALQLISVGAFILSVYYLNKIIQIVFNETEWKARIYLLLFYLMSPFVLRASVVIMSDMLAICFIVLACYHFILFQKLTGIKNFYGLIFFFSAAVMTRYAVVVIMTMPFTYSCYLVAKKINFKNGAIAIILMLIPIIPHFIIRKNYPLTFVHHSWIEMWNIKNFLVNDFSTPDGDAHYSFCNLIYCFNNLFHPGFIFAGILFLMVLFKNESMKSPEIKILIASVILYALFLAGIPFQNQRFLLLTFPLILMVYFPAFVKINSYFNHFQKAKPLILVLIAGTQIALCARALQPFYIQNRIEKKIAFELLNYPDKTIYTFSIDGALKNYGVKNKIINLYKIKVDTLEKPSLVLFNEKKFSEQWKGLNPVLNWKFIKSHCKLYSLIDLPDSWELYEIR